MSHNYFVYILTNKNRTVIYTGVTNDLAIRLQQHIEGINKFSFTKKYNCHYLIFFERYQYIEHAIEREKEIKGWSRAKKNALIEVENPQWNFLNDNILNDEIILLRLLAQIVPNCLSFRGTRNPQPMKN